VRTICSRGAHLLARFPGGLGGTHHLLARLRAEELGHVLDVLGPVAALGGKHGATDEHLGAEPLAAGN
jgi:hypothetical protein